MTNNNNKKDDQNKKQEVEQNYIFGDSEPSTNQIFRFRIPFYILCGVLTLIALILLIVILVL